MSRVGPYKIASFCKMEDIGSRPMLRKVGFFEVV
jgi:hypothetical protein